MGIVNRRNAVLGWLTWQTGKRFARRKARSAVPSVEDRRPSKGAIVSALAALGGLLWFWRRRRSEEPTAGE